MTENKRYVRILDHSEKEVRIFDENNQKNIFNIFFEGLDSAICLNGALEDTVDLLNELNDENKELKDFNHYLIKLEKELRQERNQLMNPLYLWVDKKIRQLELKIDEAEGYKFLQLQYESKIEVLKELREELEE